MQILLSIFDSVSFNLDYIGSHETLVNFVSGYDLVPLDNKPWHGLTLTKVYFAICRKLESIESIIIDIIKYK